MRKASEYRVVEIKEDLPWVSDAMQKLAGLVVPCDEGTLLKTWQKAKLTPPQAAEAVSYTHLDVYKRQVRR